MSERILDLLQNQDEISWQSIIYDLVKTEQMDPWDIDVSDLARKFVDRLKQMKETDLRLSGKVVLAAVILLKIKSKRLISDDIALFDNMASGQDEESLMQEEQELKKYPKVKGIRLIPKTPQPRKRKVSVYDLVEALQQALDVKNRRILREVRIPTVEIPEKKYDISDLMRQIYSKIAGHYKTKDSKITFSQLVPNDSREGKVMTFLPLLHLSNQRKIDLEQKEHFGEIEINLAGKVVENLDDIKEEDAEA